MTSVIILSILLFLVSIAIVALIIKRSKWVYVAALIFVAITLMFLLSLKYAIQYGM